MILESIEDKVYYGFLKLIYVIKLTEDNLNIGRIMNGNDIIIRDPSISKIHAEIKYDKERRKILIKNKSNKFGTSILIKNPLIIKNKKILLQNGSTLIEAKLMKVGDFEKNINKNTKRHLPKKD
jgi:pSer/pThr/pTyr-binding forkhead associated (FHA) protein